MAAMIRSDEERRVFCDLAFFNEGGFAGLEMRPVSILSWKAMQMMQLRLIEEEGPVALGLVEETRELAVFLWLHSAPIDEVCAAMLDGMWKVIRDSAEDPAPGLLEIFRVWWVRVLMILDAVAIQIRPKPKVQGDKTPRDILAAGELAGRIAHVAHFVNESSRHVGWEMFLGQALQYFHVVMRWNGMWTVRPGEQVKAEECGDLMPGWLEKDTEATGTEATGTEAQSEGGV